MVDSEEPRSVGFIVSGVIVQSTFVLESVARMVSLTFIYLRSRQDLFDFCASLLGVLWIQSVVCGAKVSEPVIWTAQLVRTVRVLDCLIRKGYTGKSSLVQFRSTLLGVLSILSYAIVFFTILAFVGGILVTADLLPSLTILRGVGMAGWTSVSSSFGSTPQSMFSVFEVMTMDNWYVSSCRPMIAGGKWLSVFTVIFAVVTGNIGFGNLLLGCIVDKTAEVSSVYIDRDRVETDSKREETNTAMLLAICRKHTAEDINLETLMSLMTENEDVADTAQQLDIHQSDVRQLFKAVDVNNSGVILLSDLLAGLGRLRGDAVGQDVVRINSVISKCLGVADLVGTGLDASLISARSCEISLSSLGIIGLQHGRVLTQKSLRVEQDRVRSENRMSLRRRLDNHS